MPEKCPYLRLELIILLQIYRNSIVTIKFIQLYDINNNHM